MDESKRLAAGLKAAESRADGFMSKEDIQDKLQDMR
jgi:hypothetical protein